MEKSGCVELVHVLTLQIDSEILNSFFHCQKGLHLTQSLAVVTRLYSFKFFLKLFLHLQIVKKLGRSVAILITS